MSGLTDFGCATWFAVELPLTILRLRGHFAGMPTSYQELAALVSSGYPQAAPNHRYLVVNLGLALENMAVALALYRRDVVQGIGTVLPC